MMHELDHDKGRPGKITSLLVAAAALIAISIFVYVVGMWNPFKHAAPENEAPSPSIIHLPAQPPRPTTH